MQRDEQQEIHQELWESQEDEGSMELTVEEVCARARMREKGSVRAYWVVLGFTTLFTAGFIRNLVLFRDPWLITGTGWALAALCCISWRLIRSGPTRIRPAETCVQFLRREFESEREGLLWIRWLALLLFPAIVVSWWGGGPTLGAKALGIQSAWLLQILKGPMLLIVAALVLAFVWFAFSRQARKLKREIENLRGE
jgi:hypothetical protein